MDRPVADIEIDEQLVARLIGAQHPDLTGPLRLAANGWDNTIYRLGDKLCVRLPRRRVAAELGAAWLVFDAGAGPGTVPTPGTVPAAGRRSRVPAVLMHEAEHPSMAGVGRHALDQVLQEPRRAPSAH